MLFYLDLEKYWKIAYLEIRYTSANGLAIYWSSPVDQSTMSCLAVLMALPIMFMPDAYSQASFCKA